MMDPMTTPMTSTTTSTMMNISISRDTDAGLFITSSDRVEARDEGGYLDVRRRLRHQLEIVREMLGNLETQTGAGQRHVMAKVVQFIIEALRAVRLGIAGVARPSIDRSMQRLAREAGRVAPAVRPFKRRAERLLDVLSMAS